MKALLSLLALFALAGCGFEPVYAKRDMHEPSLRATLAAIGVETAAADPQFRHPADIYRDTLEDRLNPAGAPGTNPPYRLHAVIGIMETPIAISRDGTVSRYNLTVQADYSLHRTGDGKKLFSARSKRSGSYNNLVNAYYSTFVSREDAIRRTVIEAAEDTRLRLAAYLAQPELAAPAQTAIHPPQTPPVPIAP